MEHTRSSGRIIRRSLVATLLALGAAPAFGQGMWSQAMPSNSPTPTWGATLAYDAARQRVVHFGGFSSTGTWEYDGTNWTQVTTMNTPLQRYGCGLVYDPVRQVIVMLGGTDTGSFQPFDEMWEYDGTDWTQVFPLNMPDPRSTRLVYDSTRDKIIAIGGSSGGQRLSDTWEYDATANDWTQTAPDGSFTTALQKAAVYDPITQSVWTYGGIAALTLVVALASSSFPALRASRRDPVTALRTE